MAGAVCYDASVQVARSPIAHSDPDICGGTPVFVGTRVPVTTLFDYLEDGETLERFLDQFSLRFARPGACGAGHRSKLRPG